VSEKYPVEFLFNKAYHQDVSHASSTLPPSHAVSSDSLDTLHTPHNPFPPVPSGSLTSDRPLKLPLVPQGPSHSFQAPLSRITVVCMLGANLSDGGLLGLCFFSDGGLLGLRPEDFTWWAWGGRPPTLFRCRLQPPESVSASSTLWFVHGVTLQQRVQGYLAPEGAPPPGP
jgi:hypothetical protein